MPFLTLILSILGSLGGTIGARSIGPIVGRQIAKLLPRFAGNKIARGAGGVALDIAGGGAGFVAGSGIGEFLGGGAAPEPAADQAIDFSALQQLGAAGNPVFAENQAALSNLFAEEDIRGALETLGIDFDDFAALANPQGGIV